MHRDSAVKRPESTKFQRTHHRIILSMASRRNFLLALLAATFMCIVVLQMSLDGWILRGTVRYSVSVEKKDKPDPPVKAAGMRLSDVEPLSQNASSSDPKLSSPISSQSLQRESVSTNSGTLLQQRSLFESHKNYSPSKSQSPSANGFLIPQKTFPNSSNVLPAQSVSTSSINLLSHQIVADTQSNLPKQNREPLAPSVLSQLHELPVVSANFPLPSSNSNFSHLLESVSRKPSNLLQSNLPSERSLKVSAIKSFDDIQQPTTASPKQHQELQTSNKVQARIKVRSFEQRLQSRGILERKKPQEFISPQARLQEILKQGNTMQVRSRADPLRFLRNIPTVNQTDVTHVILLTYFRSGSTFVGDLLQQNWKTFYHFEPLHFMTYDSRIGIDRLQEAFDLFNSILRCNYSNLENYLMWAKKPDNQFLFERNVFLWFSCKSNPRMCFTPELVSAVCQRAPVQIMKVTRLHMRDLRVFLLQNPDIKIKVVLLTRDPRGVVSSRRTMDWCSDTQCSDPHFLCREMIDDLFVFNDMQENEPDTFIRVRYEDMALYPEKEAKRLFEFLGLSFSPAVRRFLKTHTTARKIDNLNPYSTRRNSSAMAFSWRSRLTFPQVNSIQSACSEVIHMLNFTLITSPTELDNRRSSKSSVGNSRAGKRIFPLRSSNYTNPVPAKEAVKSTSRVQVVEKDVVISNNGEIDTSSNEKGHSIQADSVKYARHSFNKVYPTSLNSISSPTVSRTNRGSLYTYDDILKNR